MIEVEIYSDIACPWCRLGRWRYGRAVAALRDEVEIRTVHRPFQLNADEPTVPQPLPVAMAARYGAEPSQRMFREMRALGAADGLEFELERGIAVNTFAAHRLLWHAGREAGPDVQNVVADKLFDAYFRDGGNVGDPDLLAGIAADSGLAAVGVRSFLASDEGIDELRAELAEGSRRGVRSVPTFFLPHGRTLAGAQSTEVFVAELREVADRPASTPDADSCPVE